MWRGMPASGPADVGFKPGPIDGHRAIIGDPQDSTGLLLGIEGLLARIDRHHVPGTGACRCGIAEFASMLRNEAWGLADSAPGTSLIRAWVAAIRAWALCTPFAPAAGGCRCWRAGTAGG